MRRGLMTLLLSSELVYIPGYNFVSNDRINKTVKLTFIYYTNSNSKLGQTLILYTKVVTRLFFKKSISLRGDVVVGTIYRPPDENVNDFLDSLRKLLSTTTRENKICYVMGNFNFDLLQHEQHATTGEFVELMFSHLLYPMI